MDPRFETRRQEMLDSAVCPPDLAAEVLPRLDAFLRPFVHSLTEPEQHTHTREYVRGLVSSLASKTGEGIADRHDRGRQGLQKFLGQVPWDHKPLVATLATQVGRQIGEPDAVLVFDPSAFPKKGPESVGVARQWCGRLGKTDNCQVGVFLGYVSRQDHTLVDFRLYLPKEWTSDRTRCREAGVPKRTTFHTRHELALEMLAGHGATLPHGGIGGDDETGRPASFRRELREKRERYLLAVPSDTRIRALEVDPPAYCGRGRPADRPFVRVARVRDVAGDGVDADRRAGGDEGSARDRGGAASGDGQVGHRRRIGGVSGGDPRVSRRFDVQALLLLMVRARRNRAAGGVGASGEGGAPDRGVLATGKGRGGIGR